jgi:sortase A
MGKIYYKKTNKSERKKVLRIISLGLFLSGLLMVLYIFLPLISWQIYFAPAFANQNIEAPIPTNNVLSSATIASLVDQASGVLSGVDYENAQNWFPKFKYQDGSLPQIEYYTISIPKLNLKDLVVSTDNTLLFKNLVNYLGTATPPNKGNAVVFGHSTLPQLYNEKDYKTVFTYLYKLTPGDEIIVKIKKNTFRYRIENVIVVDPENTSVLEQSYDDSFLTLVTCTPPGTIWKRLIVRARIEKV